MIAEANTNVAILHAMTADEVNERLASPTITALLNARQGDAANANRPGTMKQPMRTHHLSETTVESRCSSESALRRKAARQGFKLTKIRENSRWYLQYGPFMIADASTNGVVQYGMTAEEANEWLSGEQEEAAVRVATEKA